jgi:hypothetical protein
MLNTLFNRMRARIGALRNSAAVRERLLATGVFAALAAFTVASFDFIVSGGPDWTPSAQAAPPPLVRVSSLPDLAYEAPALLEVVARPRLTLTIYPDYTAAGEALLGGPFGDDAPRAYEQISPWRQEAAYAKPSALKPF